MFRIGDFARMNHISVATLRYYDDCGLLKPLYIDDATGYRYYGAEQMPRLSRIIAMKEAGLSLTEIFEHLRRGYDRGEMLELLAIKEAETLASIQSEQERLQRLRNWIIAIEREEYQDMIDVTVKKVDGISVAGLRETIPNFEVVGETWKELNDIIDACGGKKIVPCMMLYHNKDDHGPWDIEVIEPVAKPFTPTGRVRVYELPGCERMACIIHKGPFETIGKTFAAIHEWFEQNGFTPGVPMREIYHKGDWMTDDPNEYITELQFPIE